MLLIGVGLQGPLLPFNWQENGSKQSLKKPCKYKTCGGILYREGKTLFLTLILLYVNSTEKFVLWQRQTSFDN